MANLGHSLPLSWRLRSTGGHTRGEKRWPSLCDRGVCLTPCTGWGRGQRPGLQPRERGAGGVGRSHPWGCQGLGGSRPPHQQCFSTSQSWHVGRRRGTGGTPAIGRTCAMCYSIPIILNLREAVGQQEMLLLLEQTQAVLLGLYLTHSPWQGCLADGFSRLHKVFLQAPAPSLSQNSPIHVRSCCCHRLKSPRLKRGIFYPSCLLLSGGSPPAW